MSRRKETEPPPVTYPRVIEMFTDPQIQNHWKEPDCFNGIVNFRRYRITVEPIEEPVEVLAERLRALWRKCKNGHHYTPLRAAAKSIGIELESDELGIEAAR